MIELFSSLGPLTAVTTIIFGAVAVYGLWDKKSKERKKELDGEEDRLISILQNTVKELEKKVNQQDADIKSLTLKVDALSIENHTLTKVLQGRDEETQKFYKEAYTAMRTVDESYNKLKSLEEVVKEKNHNISELINLVGRQVDAIERTGSTIAEAAKATPK